MPGLDGSSRQPEWFRPILGCVQIPFARLERGGGGGSICTYINISVARERK